MPQRILIPLCTLFIIIVAWLPRGLALDVFVTPDEPRWLTRSANFYQALNTGNLAQTYQREHPGVTVMWAGTLAFITHFPDYFQQTPGPFHPDETRLEQWLETETPHTALELLAAARWWMVTWIALLLGISFWLWGRLVGWVPAFFISVWMAFEPFYIALSRQLHLDGLLTSLLLVAFLAWLLHLRAAKGWKWLVVSGLFLGLAGLTKVPAMALALFGIVGFMVEAWHQKRGVVWVIKSVLLWGGVAIAVVFALWPALWVAPISTLQEMVTVLLYYAEEGHGDGIFFLGQISRNPGWLYYPVVFFFRTHTFTLLSCLSLLYVFYRKSGSSNERRTMWWVIAFALFYVIFISISAKQQERYLLPTILFISASAAWGVFTIIQSFMPVSHSGTRIVIPSRFIVSGIVLAVIILTGVRGYPYYFDTYEPLIVGNRLAPATLTLGWGEGLDQAAAYLNEQNEMGRLSAEGRILSGYDNGPLSYFLDPVAEPISENWEPSAWCNVEYVVSYVNMWQRHLPNQEAYAYMESLTPETTISLSGIEYVRIYNVARSPLPDFAGANGGHRADFGGFIRFLGSDPLPTSIEAGTSFLLTLHLQSLRPITTDYNILVKLIAPDGSEVWRQEGFPWGAPTSDWAICTLRPDGHEVIVPIDAPAGDYRLTMEFYDPAGFTPLPVTEANSPESLLSEREWNIGTITVIR